MSAVLDSPVVANEPNFSVSLSLTPSMLKRLQTEQGALTIAQAYEIDCPEMAAEANAELKRVKVAIGEVKKMRDGFLEPAQQIIENAKALFNPALESLNQSEAILKSRLLSYQQAEEAKAEAARRAAEEIARKARQEAEAKAAAERARAEEQAREARRKEEEAREAQRKAEAEGNARAAAAAAAKAAEHAAKATAVVENAEAKATETIIAAAAMPIAEVAAPAKLEGLSFRDNWVAELAPGVEESAAIAQIAAATASRPELAAVLKLDIPAANKMAKALKGAFNIPGLKAVNKPVAASRSK